MNKRGPTQPVFKHLTRIILTQMSARSGTKKHGKTVIDTLFNDFFQLDNKTVFEGFMVIDLTSQQKRKTLRAINFLKEKRCGKLKGRIVVDGNTQRDLYAKIRNRITYNFKWCIIYDYVGRCLVKETCSYSRRERCLFTRRYARLHFT